MTEAAKGPSANRAVHSAYTAPATHRGGSAAERRIARRCAAGNIAWYVAAPTTAHVDATVDETHR